MHLLLIENNPNLSANVREFFETKGHVVDQAEDGIRGLQLACSDGYDAVVLEVGLPGLDGLSLCKRLREQSRRDVPVVMLTARSSEADKLSGFEAGADDYITKPFSLPELLARLKALVRRSYGTQEVLRVADLTFDLRTLIIQRGARSLPLTPTSMRILELLMRASPGLVSRAQIERAVWGEEPPGSDAALRGHILIIRNAIDTAGESKLLHTVHGMGYRLG